MRTYTGYDPDRDPYFDGGDTAAGDIRDLERKVKDLEDALEEVTTYAFADNGKPNFDAMDELCEALSSYGHAPANYVPLDRSRRPASRVTDPKFLERADLDQFARNIQTIMFFDYGDDLEDPWSLDKEVDSDCISLLVDACVEAGLAPKEDVSDCEPRFEAEPKQRKEEP